MKLPARIEPRQLDIPTLERLKKPRPKREHLPGLFLFSQSSGGENTGNNPKPPLRLTAVRQIEKSQQPTIERAEAQGREMIG